MPTATSSRRSRGERLDKHCSSLRDATDVEAVCAALDAGWPVNAPLPIREHESMAAPALWWAMRNLETPPEVVQLLLDRGADVNQRFTKSGLTPFMQACLSGRVDHLVMMLASGKVDLLTPDAVGWTPALAHVTASDFVEDPARLLERFQTTFETRVLPAHPHLRRDHLWRQVDQWGRTALTLGGPRTAEWLLTDGRFDLSDLLEQAGDSGVTPLLHLCRDPPCLRLLLQAGARIVDGPGGPIALVRRVIEQKAARGDLLAPLDEIEAMLAAGLARQAINDLLDGSLSQGLSPARCA